ncbi:MAG: hypothetical protein LQ347_001000 [Umbilicaria vellea]|nr:MAG: hypothetical protein LQ347_001000 [Umbilicaria vellea]
MVMEDSMQPNTISKSEKDQMTIKSNTELGDKAASGTSKPSKTSSDPEEEGRPQVHPMSLTSPFSPRLSLTCASKMAVFLAALDITIVSTALPTISDYFQSTSGYTWIG